MTRNIRRAVLALTCLYHGVVVSAFGQEPVRDLRIDPLLLVSVKEFRNIIRTIGPDLFPGWDALSVPLLLYRPQVQDVLVNAPRRPPGFSEFVGRSVLSGETIYARNDSTVKQIDGQNTQAVLDSMRVLVVADQYSRERQQIQANVGRPPEFLSQWLANWGWVQSPYDELELILHEAFHVHQNRLAPNKWADESAVARYPLLDAGNNALVALEAQLLAAAVLTKDKAQRRVWTEEFLAARAARRANLDTASVSYENLNEFVEGLGRYVELKFMQLGEHVRPIDEMYLYSGFKGYHGVLANRLSRRMEEMVKVASFNDDRFGNRFGSGPMRFRLYDMGAAQALLLDDVVPQWRSGIFADGVYLTDLLAAALPLSAARRDTLLARAKSRIRYDTIFVNRQAFEREGRQLIQQRVDAIVNTKRTRVTIDYSGVGEELRMAYTPFGVTGVNEHAAIYDLTPLAFRFANKAVLRMKSVIPVIVDRKARTLTFAVNSAASAFSGQDGKAIDVAELSLTAAPGTSVSVRDNQVRISLR